MKVFYSFLVLLLCSFMFISCKDNSSDSAEDPNTLNGDTNVEIAQVGSKVTLGSVNVGGKYVNINGTLEVTKNENGVATVKLNADLSKDASLAAFNNWIPKAYKDTSGKISTTVKFKVTTEGIQTYFAGESPHTLIKYADNVGATYSITRSDGSTYTRKITEKSDQDVYPYGLYLIKVTTVEQTDTRMAGIKKIVFKANHKFGLVNVAMVADDGSTASAYLY